MATLSSALTTARQRRRPVLVLGPQRDPKELTRELEAALGHQVTRLDCTAACPPAAEIRDRFAKGLKKGRALHVACARELPALLRDALLAVISDQKLPDGAAVDPLGLLVLSARVRRPSELWEGMSDYLFVHVGAGE